MDLGRLVYFITGIFLLIGIIGCDSQKTESFSVKVQVENQDSEPVGGAEVGVRPCHEIGCGASSKERSVRAKDVTLSSFSASVDGNDIILEWKTEEEVSNSGFRVERKDDSSFEQVYFVDGAGTTSQPQSYRYRDRGLPPGEYSYRLVAVDTDGNESPTDPLSVRMEGPEDTEIQPIFPNPFSSETTLVLKAADPSRILSTVHLLNGEKVATLVDQEVQIGRYAYSWPTDKHQAGLYQIRTQIQIDDQTVARDTGYAVYSSSPSNAAPIGTTSADGTISTNNRTHFPGLFDIPEVDLRDENGNDRGTLSTVPETTQFVVITQGDRYTFERRVVEGENNITLTINP